MTPHPGAIVFFNEGCPPHIRPLAEVPASVCFVGDEPVVRVVSSHCGQRRVVRSYGVNHRLLQTTWSVKAGASSSSAT